MIESSKDIHNWEERLFDAIRTLGDIDFQKEVWLGKGTKYVYSFDEVINILYDDSFFLEYLEYYKTVKGENKFYRRCVELDAMIDNYEEKETEEMILNDPNWIRITDKAKAIIPLLNYTI